MERVSPDRTFRSPSARPHTANAARGLALELVVQLERWEPGRAYERLGLDDHFYEILGLRVVGPHILAEATQVFFILLP